MQLRFTCFPFLLFEEAAYFFKPSSKLKVTCVFRAEHKQNSYLSIAVEVYYAEMFDACVDY